MNETRAGGEIAVIAKTAWILWGAFVVPMAFYGILPRVIVLPGEATTELGMVFWIVSGALALGALAYRRWAFSDETLRRAGGWPTQPGARQEPAQAAGNVGDTGMSFAISAREQKRISMARLALRHQIVVLALAEAIAVLGFVHALLARDGSLALPFVGAAIALALTSFPRVNEVVERARAWG